jgi:hypothetical protein
MIIDADAHFTPELEYTGNVELDCWIQDYLIKKSGMFSDADNRQLEMLMLGVDRQLLNPMGPSLGLSYQLDTSIANKVMQVYNDSLYQLSQLYDCYDMNIWLCLQDLDASFKELDRFRDRKFFAVYAAESPEWGFINQLEPLWQRLNNDQIPFYIHLTKEEDQLNYAVDASKFLTLKERWAGREWVFSVVSFILGGVLDRYPDLRIVVAERDINWISEIQKDMIELTGIDPLLYFKKNFWFTTEPESKTFLANANILGYDRLLFATDWPHDHDIGGSNSRHDVETVHQLGLSNHNLQLLCKNNYLYLCRT